MASKHDQGSIRYDEENPFRDPKTCDHGVTFDEAAAKGLDHHEIRKRWPRLFGECPKGCGFSGIAYADKAHYVFGDW